jgi:hypothetical protein
MTQVTSLQDYEAVIAESDVQKNQTSHDISLSNALRSLVSKKKKRFINSKFNLDLACTFPLPISTIFSSLSFRCSSICTRWQLLAESGPYFLLFSSRGHSSYQPLPFLFLEKFFF